MDGRRRASARGRARRQAGAGLLAAVWGLNHERLSIAAQTVGGADRAIGLATAHLHRAGGIGTIGGDDTILIVVRSARETPFVQQRFADLKGGHSTSLRAS